MANSDWNEVSVDELHVDLQQLYADSKAAYKVYKARKAEFELAMQAQFVTDVPSGCELKFGYNFGKLSVAIGPRIERKGKAKESKPSLGDWLASQQAQGRSA